MEAPDNNLLCHSCQNTPMLYRCSDCHGNPQFCKDCLLTSHSRLPTHRVQIWVGSHFKKSTLFEAGYTLHFGHNGLPCPTAATNIPEERKASLTLVDVTGIHKHYPKFCTCPGHPQPWEQAFKMAYYPASTDRPSTLFTFSVLDYFYLDNMETDTAARGFMTRLMRLTNTESLAKASCTLLLLLLHTLSHSPSISQDRYKELLRVSREWNDLQNRKRAGFAHDPQLAAENKPGSLAVFCPACPQPGINLPVNWKQDQLPWRFMRVMMLDGCFKADHLAMNSKNDICLADGLMFWVGHDKYQEHLLKARESQEVLPPLFLSHCNSFTTI